MSKTTSYFTVGLLIGGILCSLFYGYLSRQELTNGDANAPRAKTLKMAHALPTNHPVHVGIEHMAEVLNRVSGGKMEMVIFPSGQMGDETKCIEQVQMGTLAMTKTSTSPMSNFVDLMKLFSLPYLFKNTDHFWTVLEGEIGQELLQRLASRDDGKPSGFVGLGYFDSGSRNFYSNEPILGIDDIKGKKFRVMRDPVAMDMVEALGGSPTPIPWGELYTALKQGVVDGAENNPPSIIASRHSEICKYYIPDAHTRIPDLVIVSQKTWDRLNDEEKGWLTQAMKEATAFQRDLWTQSTQEALEKMKAEGVTINEIDDAPFREAVKPVVEKHASGEIMDFYKRIQNVQ